ncbi:polysaccharide lyase family 7 protein [Pseudomonas tussilaginis]|uniref:polysaccharide lyase family 7 protein n=1 Tax=unclassified Pseudomonas TaxID=196821 RepID=UPI000C6CD80F|nr:MULTISPECIES: polysaccharide lyase family 7 protein [unclassified Pseudomonas]QYX49394.1 polysaccharide lyase family 7 protein [Pseudomonas sp. S11A 273]
MTVNINNLIIATPVPKSSTDPVALELTGAEALDRLPAVLATLADGSVRFTAPTKGASSKSTHRTRCEWKEPVYWALDSADEHRNHQVMTLTQVNHAQKVVISQLHVKNDDSPPLKVFWNKGKISYGFRQSFNQASPASITLLNNVPLDTPFQVTVDVSGSGVLTLTAKCNGNGASTGPLQLDASWKTRIFNFHGGVYNQVDYTDATPASDASVCILSTLQLRHD